MREMKDSGIQWIGRMPEHWNVYPIKSIILQNDGGIWGEDPDDNVNNTIVLRSTEQTVDGKWNIIEPAQRDLTSISNADYYRCIEGDLLITKSSGSDLHIGKTTIVDENIEKMKCCYSNFIQRIRVDKSYEPRLIWYLFNSSIVREQFVYMQNSTSGIGNLNAKYIAELRIPLPGKEEQHRIINYLDEKCAKIDSIIEKQQEIIEKLKEYKLSVITEAVTKGLNPDVEMKDSGDDRIGYIPIKWSKIKITRLLDYAKVYPIGDGDHGLIKANNYKEEGIPYIRVQNLGWGTDLLLDNVVYISEEDNERIINSELHPNDILFCKTGATIGKIGIVPHEIKRANTTSHVGKITLDCKYNSRFVFYYLSSEIGYEKFWDIACMKSTRPELSIEEIKSIYVAVPTFREEQDAIVNYLDNICSGIEARKEKVEKMLTKLQDYKKSLIYEVVTGKMEV